MHDMIYAQYPHQKSSTSKLVRIPLKEMLEIEPKCCNDAGIIATLWFVFEHIAGM